MTKKVAKDHMITIACVVRHANSIVVDGKMARYSSRIDSFVKLMVTVYNNCKLKRIYIFLDSQIRAWKTSPCETRPYLQELDQRLSTHDRKDISQVVAGSGSIDSYLGQSIATQ